MDSTEVVTLNGLTLECETIDDDFKKAIAEHHIPYRRKPLLDDMGGGSQKIWLRCYFYEDTYEAHKDLLALLQVRSLFDLVHPKYGLLRGAIENVSVRHSDLLRTAEIDLTFIEGDDAALSEEVRRIIDAESAVEEQFTASLAEQYDEISADIANDLAAEAATVLGATLTPGLPMADQINGISYNAREYLKEIDASVASFETLQVGVQNPANSLLATISFTENLPGRIIGSMARTVERYCRAFDSLVSFPARFLDAVKIETDNLIASFDVADTPSKGKSVARAMLGKHLRISSAQRLSLEAASLYKADETGREELRKSEARRPFDALGNYRSLGEAPTIMTMDETEKTLAVVRGSIQNALAASRGMTSLKSAARTLLEHVNTIKLERDRIVQVTLHNPTPLHLVCLAQGLPYAYAERIHSLNRIQAPNFTEGTINVYAR
jgi:prophage DNA circulation protein